MSAVRKVQGGNVMVEQMKMRGQEREKEGCGKEEKWRAGRWKGREHSG